MFIFNSSIGRKFIQSISGAFLFAFLLLHATINSFSVIDSFSGKYGSVANDDALFSAGDGLYKLGCDFMSTPLITVLAIVLAVGFLIHILYGIWLTFLNIRASGRFNRGMKRYEVPCKARTDSWSSKNMAVLGIVIVGFIIYHLTGFWAKMQLPEAFGIGTFENNPYILLETVFGNWWALLLYLIWFAALWFHLTHGFWSMFQTVGWSGQKWMKRTKVIGNIVSTLICLTFAIVGINAFIQAL